MESEQNNLLGKGGYFPFNWKNWKTALLGIVGVMFALVVMVVSVGAAMDASGPASESAVVLPIEASLAAVQKVEYYLPYPGILPDNPLYKIKAARDRVKLWLTFNEADKAKLELQLADKRINAAQALSDGNKPELAITTATKAEKYLELSTNRVIKLINNGQDEKSQLLNLEKAIAKHGELLLAITEKSGDGENQAMSESMKLNKLLGERVGQTLIESK